MKNLFTIATLIVVATTTLPAQDSLSNPRAIIKLNPIELFSSTFMMEYENIYKNGTKGLAFGLGATFNDRPDYGNERTVGLKGEIVTKTYFGGFKQKVSKKDRNYLLGIYGAFFLRGGYEESEREFYSYNPNGSTMETNTRKGIWMFPGAMVGISRTYWDYLLVDVYIGAGVRITDVSNSNADFDYYYYYNRISPLDYSGVSPNIGFKLGLLLF